MLKGFNLNIMDVASESENRAFFVAIPGHLEPYLLVLPVPAHKVPIINILDSCHFFSAKMTDDCDIFCTLGLSCHQQTPT